MKHLIAAIILLFLVTDAIAGTEWQVRKSGTATTRKSLQYSVPVGTKCEPDVVDQSASGAVKYHLVPIVTKTDATVRVPFDCVAVTVPDPVPPVVTPPIPPVVTPPVVTPPQPPSPPVTSTAEADFAARCAALGVLKCEGFDAAASFVPATGTDAGLHAPSGAPTSAVRGFQDGAVSASGSSLRFDIRSGTDADTAGGYVFTFGQAFGQGSEFYLQYRYRADATMASFDWSTTGNATAPKISVLYGLAGGPCQQVEATTVSYAYAQSGSLPLNILPTMYSACGAVGMEVNSNTGKWTAPTVLPKLLQSPTTISPLNGYSCDYNAQTGPNCFRVPANKWVTFYYHFKIGTWGQPNSMVEAWVAMDGGPYKQFINVPNMTFRNDSPTQDNNFSRVMLTPYMTGKQSGIAHPNAAAWYDEVIVSTQPIAPPGN